jgi:hypothetical protein
LIGLHERHLEYIFSIPRHITGFDPCAVTYNSLLFFTNSCGVQLGKEILCC